MGYNKAIIYGANLDLYTYEKDIQHLGAKRTKTQSDSDRKDLGSNGILTERLEAWRSRRSDNKRRAVMAFRRLVLSNMVESPPPFLITCTYATNQTDLRVGYEDFKAFSRALRTRFGRGFRYIAVPEFQKRGALHFHALAWGLPEDLAKRERSTRLVAQFWDHGFVDVYLTDGDEKISSYLAKYMSKCHDDIRLFEKKTYRCSRNVFRPIVEKNAMLTHLEYVYGIGVDNPPCKDKTFETQWMGQGRYRYYKLSIKN